jgi:hypothetical protein
MQVEFIPGSSEWPKLARLSLMAEQLLGSMGDSVLESLMFDSGVEVAKHILTVNLVRLAFTEEGPELHLYFNRLEDNRRITESFRVYCSENDAIKGDYLL